MVTSKTRSQQQLLKWDDLLQWQGENEYILTGYRPASSSFSRSAVSIFSRHNETVNIWSHMLGALMFSIGPLYALRSIQSQYPNVDFLDLIQFAIYFTGVTVCFTLSSFFHTFLNHSKRIWTLGNELDHLGIVLVMWGSMVPSDYFGFYCNPILQSAYILIATISAVGCGVFTMQPRFRTPGSRFLRAAMFAIFGLSAFVPVLHGIIINGWDVQNQQMSITFFLGLGILNGTGTANYAVRVPERWYPTRFDIYGSSHQIMHTLVVCGAVSHTVGLVKAFKYWQLQKSSGLVCNDISARR